MPTAVQNSVQLKPETLAKLQAKSEACDICRNIVASVKEGNVLSERGGISVEAQARHIKVELAALTSRITQPLPLPPPKLKEEEKTEKVSAWPDSLKDETVERLKKRIPKDEDSPGCQLCKWIVQALGPGNVLRDHPVGGDHKEFLVKSQKMHLALEFGETEP